MKLSFISLIPVLLCGCLLSPDVGDNTPKTKTGSVEINVRLNKTTAALSKVASADTIFRLDSLYIKLTCPGQTTINTSLAVSGRADSSNISVATQTYTGLAPLRTWKANFISLDTVFNLQATAQTGSTSSTIKLNSGASAVDNAYTGMGVQIISGTGIGQVRHISGYVGSTKVATVSTNWTTTPTNTSVFRIYLKDTVHVDSVSFVVNPGDTAMVSKTLNARYSILRIRVKSDSAALVPNAVKKVRFKVDGTVRDSVTLNSKTFDQLLTYKYLTPNTNHTVLVQVFDIAGVTRGYERSKVINIPSNKDTTVSLDTTIRTSTAQSGSTTSTIKLDASASAVNDDYSGMVVKITSGTGVGQYRNITDYVASTKVATISPNWTTTPTNTSQFQIFYSLRKCDNSDANLPGCTP